MCQNATGPGASASTNTPTPTYTVVAADAGYKLVLAVSANNTAGTSATTQWCDCPAATSNPTASQCTAATSGSGANAQTYTPGAGDVNYYLSAVVTASNGISPNAVSYSTPTKVAASGISSEGVVGAYTTGASTTYLTSITVPVRAAVPAGNTLILALKVGSGATITVADSKGDSWTVDKAAGSSAANATLAHSLLTHSLSTSDTVTVTFSAEGYGDTAELLEFSGLQGTADATGAAVNSSGMSATVTVSANTAQSSELAVTVDGVGGASSAVSPTWSPPTGWTEAPAGVSDNYEDAAHQIL